MKNGLNRRRGFFTFLTALLLFCGALLSGCFTQTTHSASHAGLRLSPASFAHEVSLFQRITVHQNGRTNALDVALEIDADRIDLVGLAMGQRVLTLHYDGKTLTSSRHTMLPKEVQAEDVLENLQMALWPEEAVRDALLSGWEMAEGDRKRFFYHEGQLKIEISYSTDVRWIGVIEMRHRQFGYHLVIDSVLAAS